MSSALRLIIALRELGGDSAKCADMLDLLGKRCHYEIKCERGGCFLDFIPELSPAKRTGVDAKITLRVFTRHEYRDFHGETLLEILTSEKRHWDRWNAGDVMSPGSRRTEADSATITADRVKELPSKIDRTIVIAVCEDGSQWTFDGVGEWQRLPITPDLRKRIADAFGSLQYLFARHTTLGVDHSNYAEYQRTFSQLSSLLDSLGVPRE